MNALHCKVTLPTRHYTVYSVVRLNLHEFAYFAFCFFNGDKITKSRCERTKIAYEKLSTLQRKHVRNKVCNNNKKKKNRAACVL